LIDKMNTQGVYAYAWEDMARELDQVLARFGARKTFGNIVALQCVNRTKDSVFKDGTARSFAAAIVGSPDFQAGRAASLAVGLRIGIGESGGSISGHAIAVHYAAANELYLFDPNLGIYQTRSPAAMKTALETLMGPVWSAMGWSLDGSFGYAFFKAKTVPTPRSNERPVDYSSNSPTVTALKNQSIGTLPSVVGGGSTTVQKPPPKTPVIQTTQQFAPQSPPVVIGGNRRGGPGKLNADLLSKFGGS
jgi:hypothetical protein